MPRDFAKVRARFWTGETGRQIRGLGLEARVVAAYLLTCASSNMIGLYYLPMALLCHETGIPLEGACKALRSLESIGFAHYDEGQELVFVPRMAAEQISEQLEPTDKQCAGVARELKGFAKSRFFASFVYLYRTAFHLPESMGIGSPLEGPCKALRSQEHEQEQEDPSPYVSDPLSVPDPDSKQGAKLLPANEPGKPPAREVLNRYGTIRAEICGTKAIFWQPTQSATEKAAAWLTEMTREAVGDIEPAIRLACEHVKRGDEGWTGAKMSDPNFLWGTIIAKWTALREELHHCAPAVTWEKRGAGGPKVFEGKW